jgi:hypothetical protein
LKTRPKARPVSYSLSMTFLIYLPALQPSSPPAVLPTYLDASLLACMHGTFIEGEGPVQLTSSSRQLVL